MIVGLLVENAAPFVCEEVAALRNLGMTVRVASVFRPTDPTRWERDYAGPVLYPRRSRPAWVGRALRDTLQAPKAVRSLVQRAREEGAPLRLVALAGSLARVARRERWSHVHASFATFPAWTAGAVAQLAGISFSLTAHAYDLQRPRPWLPRLLHDAAFVRAISREGAGRLRALATRGGTIRVGHLGVDVQRFQPCALNPESGRPLEILSVARLGPTKGHADLIEACARLAAERGMPDFRLRLLGDGPLRPELEARVRARGMADRVSFEGDACRAAVARATARAAIFALPCVTLAEGRHDGLPVAILEALAGGLPVVSTPVGGIPEAVCDGVNGRLVPEADVPALARSLGELLVDGALRERLSGAARATALSRFRGEDAAARLAGWLDAAVNGAPRSMHDVAAPGPRRGVDAAARAAVPPALSTPKPRSAPPTRTA